MPIINSGADGGVHLKMDLHEKLGINLIPLLHIITIDLKSLTIFAFYNHC